MVRGLWVVRTHLGIMIALGLDHISERWHEGISQGQEDRGCWPFFSGNDYTTVHSFRRNMSSDGDGSKQVCMSVDPGVCRFKTKIMVRYEDGIVHIEMVSDCPHVNKVKGVLKDDLNPFEAMKMPFSANPIYEACGKVLAHSACPVPSAMIKTVEVAAGLGLKRPVKFEFDC